MIRVCHDFKKIKKWIETPHCKNNGGNNLIPIMMRNFFEIIKYFRFASLDDCLSGERERKKREMHAILSSGDLKASSRLR